MKMTSCSAISNESSDFHEHLLVYLIVQLSPREKVTPHVWLLRLIRGLQWRFTLSIQCFHPSSTNDRLPSTDYRLRWLYSTSHFPPHSPVLKHTFLDSIHDYIHHLWLISQSPTPPTPQIWIFFSIATNWNKRFLIQQFETNYDSFLSRNSL
jgi:hypothetical protein